jgi:hypothetical protein
LRYVTPVRSDECHLPAPLEHAVSLGNQKPKCLRDTENALWKMLFDMAAGGDPGTGITSLLQRFEEIETSGEPLERDWFFRGMW